jgi:RNA polymerase sigma-70 factor (ECF subfamily)
MEPTRASLLIRLKDPQDGAAWRELHELYGPLLYSFARSSGLNHDQADDIRATCFEELVRQLPTFEYDKAKGGFKALLRTMVHRRMIDLLRKRREAQADSSDLAGLPDRGLPPDEAWEASWRQHHLKHCVDRVRSQVPQATFDAFQMLLDEDASVSKVCERLGLNANQVYKAKSRVLELVRREMLLLDPECQV